MATEPIPSPTPKKPFLVWVVVLVVAAVAVTAVVLAISQSPGEERTNTPTGSVNAAANTNATANAKTNATSNASLVNSEPTDDLPRTYQHDKYLFRIHYPQQLIAWEAELSPSASSTRADGLLFDAGFRPDDLQGSIVVVRVFDRSLEEVAHSTTEHGQLTGVRMTVNGNIAIQMTGSVRRYGIQGSKYSYIIQSDNYRDEGDLRIFDEMLDTLELL